MIQNGWFTKNNAMVIQNFGEDNESTRCFKIRSYGVALNLPIYQLRCKVLVFFWYQ